MKKALRNIGIVGAVACVAGGIYSVVRNIRRKRQFDDMFIDEDDLSDCMSDEEFFDSMQRTAEEDKMSREIFGESPISDEEFVNPSLRRDKNAFGDYVKERMSGNTEEFNSEAEKSTVNPEAE